MEATRRAAGPGDRRRTTVAAPLHGTFPGDLILHGAGRTLALTGVALVAFASNSILCRMALGAYAIDPASFTSVRLASGAVTLALLSMRASRGPVTRDGGGWISAAFLFLYAFSFSFAYVRLPAGTGALILFGAVQVTMLTVALRAGEHPGRLEWSGLGVALVGLAVLTSPGLTAPSPGGSVLMALAGASWGLYTLRGRGTGNPLIATSRNFLRAVPFALAVTLATLARVEITPPGVLLAVASGALASGVGYAIWYAALRGLSATRAATVQLSVPVLAAFGGVLFLSESVTWRVAGSAVLILGGVGLALAGRVRSLR